MGDSFISGEAGRWQGNSTDASGSRWGTDRAYLNGTYDAARVYGWTASNGCHRSDVAEVVSSSTDVTETENIACSGATTQNIWRSSAGGQSFKGEVPQADRLAGIASTHKVKMIVLSIGGNDLGFSDIISACVEDYVLTRSRCHTAQQSAVDSKMTAAMSNVGKAIDEIHTVMSANGHPAWTYRLVLQSYSSPLPRAADNQLSQIGSGRINAGCPMYDEDLNWARDSLVPQLSANLRHVADTHGAEFLDLQNALQGHEVCAKGTAKADLQHAPSKATSEWFRMVNTGTLQGDMDESLHPNAFGQKVLGTCLSFVYATAPGDFSCTTQASSTGVSRL
ncbi:GDSL-type esterase/lipase family protein [Streptomyces sp. NPDC059688]|uniref:GDSL-type esterase/lipase family protein n=1 Tax=Streptomyces sp. NPDC059688 TaxID=3346906 RepID=UPI0036A821FC